MKKIFLILFLLVGVNALAGLNDIKTCVWLFDSLFTRQLTTKFATGENQKEMSPELTQSLRTWATLGSEFDGNIEWTNFIQSQIKAGVILKVTEGNKEFYVQPIEVYPGGALKAKVFKDKNAASYNSETNAYKLNPTQPSVDETFEYFFLMQDITGPFRFQYGSLLMFSNTSVRPPFSEQLFSSVFNVSDLKFTLRDKSLTEKIMPRLSAAVENETDRGFFYEKLKNEIRKVLITPEDHQDLNVRSDGLIFGDRVCKFGGSCRHSAALAYIFLNSYGPSAAHFIISTPKGVKENHMFVITEDGYLIDPAYNSAFKMEYDENGSIILPAKFKDWVFANYPQAEAASIIHDTNIHYQSAQPNSPFRLKSDRPLQENWDFINLVSTSTIKRTLLTKADALYLKTVRDSPTTPLDLRQFLESLSLK